MYLALLRHAKAQVCVILCIIVNFNVIVEPSDFILVLGLLMFCFFLKENNHVILMVLHVFVCILKISQVKILIVTVVKVFSY